MMCRHSTRSGNELLIRRSRPSGMTLAGPHEGMSCHQEIFLSRSTRCFARRVPDGSNRNAFGRPTGVRGQPCASGGLFCVSESNCPARSRISVLFFFAGGTASTRACATRQRRGQVLDRTGRGAVRQLRPQTEATRRRSDTC